MYSTHYPSALVRNDQGLLTKSDPGRDDSVHPIWHAPNAGRTFSAAYYGCRPWEVRSLHAFGVDDAAPGALALRQILFFVWVTFVEHKLVILGERRGIIPARPVSTTISERCPSDRVMGLQLRCTTRRNSRRKSEPD